MRAFLIRSDHRRHDMGQKGFSLVELLVVVCIIGLLATGAVVTMATGPEVEDECAKIAALVNEAARQAISGGSVSPEQSASRNERHRGRLRILQEPGGPAIAMERAREPTLIGDDLVWLERRRVHLGHGIILSGWSDTAALNLGSTPAFPPAHEAEPTWCFPDGTCKPMTLYLQDAKRPQRKARVVVLPLNGMMTQCFSGW